jgi:hypothetical protein
MKFGLAFNRPDGEGGTDVEGAAKPIEQTIPDELAGYLKSKGLDPDDPKALVSLWEDRGVEVKNAQKFRKRAQEAEKASSQGQKLKLTEMLPRLEEEDKQIVESWITKVDNSTAKDEALNLIAEAGIKMTPEVLGVVDAGPAATKAYLAAIQKLSASTGNDESIDQRIEQAVRRVTGVAADQTQRDQSKDEKPKSVLDQFLGPRTKAHDFIDKMRESANKSQAHKE